MEVKALDDRRTLCTSTAGIYARSASMDHAIKIVLAARAAYRGGCRAAARARACKQPQPTFCLLPQHAPDRFRHDVRATPVMVSLQTMHYANRERSVRLIYVVSV
ncbi:hypothetical protein EVAR_31521_1 [Eumeta japonica]|uniref:Uncharacterized protein n=1 Tax=Eumeta variegata TaxID=151549 RepID=A0A4C1Z2V8_EUMVA|nr:hypothetical protein EVAR_31521_1 [Eumeta japonica]